MYRGSPFRSTLNTSYITGLDMCKVCTEAVRSVALSKRTSAKKRNKKSGVLGPLAKTWSHIYIHIYIYTYSLRNSDNSYFWHSHLPLSHQSVFENLTKKGLQKFAVSTWIRTRIEYPKTARHPFPFALDPWHYASCILVGWLVANPRAVRWWSFLVLTSEWWPYYNYMYIIYMVALPKIMLQAYVSNLCFGMGYICIYIHVWFFLGNVVTIWAKNLGWLSYIASQGA